MEFFLLIASAVLVLFGIFFIVVGSLGYLVGAIAILAATYSIYSEKVTPLILGYVVVLVFAVLAFRMATPKKKLNDELSNGIIVELGMFHSWLSDKHNGEMALGQQALSEEAIKDIFKRILIREKIEFGDADLWMVTKLSMSFPDLRIYREMREKTNFDSKVAGFCKSINLPIDSLMQALKEGSKTSSNKLN